MTGRNSRKCDRTAGRGFTLIEILIVISIMGILASTLLTYAIDARDRARKVGAEAAALEAQQAIQLYRQHTGTLPNLIESWDYLTRPQVVNGTTYGPFLHHRPINYLFHANHSCITDGTQWTISTNDCAFLYDYDSGNGTGRFVAALEP